MQSTPIRLQQAIWTAFQAARPKYGSITNNLSCAPTRHVTQSLPRATLLRKQSRATQFSQLRFYADNSRGEIEKKIEDAQNKIGESIGSRAENTISEDSLLKKDETIIHTIPESSSIVHNPDSPGETAARGQSATRGTLDAAPEQSASEETKQDTSSSTTHSTPWHAELPSQLRTQYSSARHNFHSFMDNFQTHIFTASKRLNDLTGYSSIERLKRDIEDQEHAVRAARQNVRDSRAAYSTAIETRSATQREVNDLLHRKHAWSSGDLERFTSLYRSDHANEQDEQKAHSNLSAAEGAYEEASTKLSKSILARYHEEQVWSDKIRQMSTWGTWGLMGLNVLLFIVFQILVEPWRRRRLVRGFEEKVQEALKTNAEDKQLIANLQAEKIELHQDLKAKQASLASGTATAVLGDTVIPVVDASIESSRAAATDQNPTPPATESQIEQAAEVITTAEVLSTSTTLTPPDTDSSIPSTPLTVDSTSIIDPTPPINSNQDPIDPVPSPSPVSLFLSSLTSNPDYNLSELPTHLGKHTRHYLDQLRTKVARLFDEGDRVTLTRREVTSKMLEGAFFGAVGVVTLFWVVGVGSR